MPERAFTALSLLVLVHSLSAAELPVIQMPEYVISGVEQATALTGLKLEPAIGSEPLVPDSRAGDRPSMAVPALDSYFEKPSLHFGLGEPQSELEIRAGGFGHGSGRVMGISEKRTTAFQVQFRIVRPPVRTLVGPRTAWDMQTNVIRWIGRDVTLKVNGGYEESHFVRRRVDPFGMPIEGRTRISLRQSDIRLRVGSTPAQLWGGRTFGQIELNYTFLDEDRDLTASADRITIVDNRKIGEGHVETELGLDAETVSVDKGGHSLINLSPTYERVFGRFKAAAGGRAYWGRAVATPTSGQGEKAQVRSGGGIILGIDWRTPFGGILEIKHDPKPRFISFSSIHRQWPALDSTARGVTIEPTFNLKAAFSVGAGNWMKLRLSGEALRARHYPYPFIRPDESYSIRTGSVTINSARIELEFDPTTRFGVTGFGTVREANLRSGEIIPFLPLRELGAEVSYRWGRYALSSDLAWLERSHSTIFGAADIPERLNLNAAFHWRPKSGVMARLGVDNLLNRRQWLLPDYDQPPTTVWAGIEWHGTWTPWY